MATPTTSTPRMTGSADAAGSPAGWTTHHMCVDISGVLRWKDKDLAKLFTDDGQRRSGKYVRDWLKLQLAQGKQVLPMGELCEGFSFITGCPGHPSAETENVKTVATCATGDTNEAKDA